jgi:hypothetical protein
MPGARRHFVCYRGVRTPCTPGVLNTEIEITELRLWNKPKDGTSVQPTTASAPSPARPADQS